MVTRNVEWSSSPKSLRASAPKTHSGYYEGDECGGEAFEGGPFAVLIRSISLSPPGGVNERGDFVIEL